uniref:Pentacotripeptide-repeat region of PRORP domain-containing protein n=1 Tax=Fagus sylvatica TaxID=28930 RepID=A0A2N9FIZ2_FAGSY
MAFTHQHLPPPFPFVHTHYPNPHSQKPYFSLHSKTPNLLSLFATPPTSTSTSSHSSDLIFLPFLQEKEDPEAQEEEQDDAGEEEEEEEDDDEEEGDPEDSMIRFFRSRTSASTQDPQREAKLSLQKNRRSAWHLASDIVSETETESDIGDLLFEEKEQMSHVNSDSRPLPEGIVGEIVKIARDLPENLTLGEVLGDYEKRVGEKQCVEVLGLMGEEGLVKGCLYFFEWMGLQEPSLVTPRACSVLFPVLGRAGMSEKLMVLFSNLPSKKEFRDVHVYNAAISGLLCSGSYNDAWKVYEAMETNNVRPDHVTCSIMITIMRKTGRCAKDAWEFFERMNRKGVKWSIEVLGALIKSFCDEGLKNEALIIQTEMEKKGISSNTIVYNTLMDAFGKSNQIEEAEGLFAEMKVKGLKPTSATYNTLMDAYSRRMQADIKKMSDMAADAFLRMKKVGIKPTSHSYTALIHAYSVSGWHEKAYTAFENMQRERIKPSIETYTALLDAFRRAGDTQTLMKIWKLMISEKVEGTRVTFNILLDGFAKQGHYIEARDVVSEFGKMGLQPTVITYNMLMNAYARGGQHLKLPQLFNEMAGLNLKPDSVTYSTMIYGFVRVRDFKEGILLPQKDGKKWTSARCQVLSEA